MTVCIIGAGNGGIAMAGHLGLKGHHVHLYTRDATKARAISRRGGITITGAVNGFGRVRRATTHIATAIEGARVIMVTTPASAHAAVARALTPHLQRHQVVLLNPGRTGGALQVRRIFRAAGKNNVVAEAQTFIYASRAETPTQGHIYDVKRAVPVAALPAHRTDAVLRRLGRLYPEFMPARTVLETSFANIGAIFHPAPLILNASKVENGVPFDYYHEGITPSVATLMECIDAERLAVAAALDVPTISATEWLAAAYNAHGANLYDAIHDNASYRGIKAPRSLNHRYITEDVPTGLIPIASFGRHLHIPTPYTDSLIHMACGITGVDYWQRGRTLDSLGLAHMNAQEIQLYVNTGIDTATRQTRPDRGPTFIPAEI